MKPEDRAAASHNTAGLQLEATGPTEKTGELSETYFFNQMSSGKLIHSEEKGRENKRGDIRLRRELEAECTDRRKTRREELFGGDSPLRTNHTRQQTRTNHTSQPDARTYEVKKRTSTTLRHHGGCATFSK